MEHNNVRLIDAVEVVRCQACKNWDYLYNEGDSGLSTARGLCTVDVPDIDGVVRWGDDFCSYGERRLNDGNNS